MCVDEKCYTWTGAGYEGGYIPIPEPAGTSEPPGESSTGGGIRDQAAAQLQRRAGPQYHGISVTTPQALGTARNCPPGKECGRRTATVHRWRFKLVFWGNKEKGEPFTLGQDRGTGIRYTLPPEVT